jgi:Tfp pilus assembly protein PilN
MNAPNQLSFLPEDYLVRKAQHRTNVLCAGLFVVMIGAITVAFVVADRSTKAAETRHNVVDAQYVEASRRISQMQSLQQKQQVLARQAELASSLIDRVPRSYMLAEITNVLPVGVSLTDMEMSSRKRIVAVVDRSTAFEKKRAAKNTDKTSGKDMVLPPPPDVYDVGIKLTGVAQTDAQVAILLGKLKDSRLFQNVELLISAQLESNARRQNGAEETPDTLRKFTIDLLLNPSADIAPAASAGPAKIASSTEVSQ